MGGRRVSVTYSYTAAGGYYRRRGIALTAGNVHTCSAILLRALGDGVLRRRPGIETVVSDIACILSLKIKVLDYFLLYERTNPKLLSRVWLTALATRLVVFSGLHRDHTPHTELVKMLVKWC